MKLGPVGGELFHADGRTDRQEANSRCSQFCKHVYNFLPPARRQSNPSNPVTLLTDSSIPGSLA